MTALRKAREWAKSQRDTALIHAKNLADPETNLSTDEDTDADDGASEGAGDDEGD